MFDILAGKEEWAERIYCPKCKAGPWRECVGAFEEELDEFHKEREDAALAQWRGLITPAPGSKSASPIETIMHNALLGFNTIQIFQQVKIGHYRVDFLVTCLDRAMIVECDGHKWHEKTPDQAARDKARDRFFVSQGYLVMRFTGREICEEPYSCADEVYQTLVDPKFA